MSTPLHEIFDVVSDNVDSVIVIFNFHGQKMRFDESSQSSKSEKLIFGLF